MGKVGMMRFIYCSKRGAVKAVSPWLGLQIMPFSISLARVGARDLEVRSRVSATSPLRCGPGPSWAIARRYFFFERSKAVETDAEETSIQGSDGTYSRCLAVLKSDGRLGGYVPRVFSPLLKKIGVALGLFD